MRTITKLQTLLVLFLTTAMIGFVGCKDDDKDVPEPTVSIHAPTRGATVCKVTYYKSIN